MKLLTKQLIHQFEKTGRQEGKRDPLVIAKFFTPWSGWSWFCTEYIPEDKEFFGYVNSGLNSERGYFSLLELQSLNGPYGLAIERDIYFEPQLCSVLGLPTFDYKDESPMDEYDPVRITEMEYADGEGKYAL